MSSGAITSTDRVGAGLTTRERRAAALVQKRVREENKAAKEELEKRGKWKLQIWIKSERSIRKPLAFSLSVWESGKRLHGGGDESAFFCRRKPSAPKPKRLFGTAHRRRMPREATADGCGAVIPGDSILGGAAVCPGCGLSWETEHIADSIFYRVPVERAAEIIAGWYRKVGQDADLYVKYRDQDIRTRMMAQRYGVRKARELKGLVIYPLWHIIRDTSSGRTVESAFKALLLA